MRKTLRIFMILALLLVNVISINVVNAAVNSDDGKITVNKAVVGKKYSIYQILKLESYDSSKDAYTYVVEEKIDGLVNPWWEFLNSSQIKDVYVKIEPTTINGKTIQVVTWINSDNASEFANIALTYAKNNDIKPTKNITATTTSIEFNELNLGYYLVDSSLGALCGLTTTRPKTSINEKNSEVVIEKLTNENGNFGSENTAQIGDVIDYKTTIYAKYGAENYVLKDVMSKGITLNKDSIKVVLVEKNMDNTVKSSNVLTLGTEYFISFNQEIEEYGCESKNCNKKVANFIIDFSAAFEKTLTDKHEIVVTYTGTINENAIVYDGKNTNESWLDYGDDNESNKSTTNTYTFKFDLVKTDDKNVLLDGAEFKLYDGKESQNQILVVFDESLNAYRIATENEISSGIAKSDTSIVVKDGFTTVVGLDNNKAYWLEEVEAPDGFNKLTSRVEVSITNNNLIAETIQNEENNNFTYVLGGVRVINTSGDMLPETGGTGTTVFVMLGSIMVISFGVLLVTKYRFSKEN